MIKTPLDGVNLPSPFAKKTKTKFITVASLTRHSNKMQLGMARIAEE